IKWRSNLNLSFYKDKVTSYYLATNRGSSFVGDGRNIAGLVGKPVYSIFSYKWAGLDPATGDPRGYVNGQVSNDYSKLTGTTATINDLVYNGPASPTVFGSLGNTIEWNNISLSIGLLYKFGYYFRKQSISYATLFSSGDGHGDFEQRWQKPGDEAITHVPSMV